MLVLVPVHSEGGSMTDILLPRPPRDSGWESDDLDMYDLPDHVELIYGALEVMMSPSAPGTAKSSFG
jgi:hypothetical protein